VRAIVDCGLGRALVDLDDDEVVELVDTEAPERSDAGVTLPLLVDADRHGSRIVAVVDRRPPLVISDDAGATWREAGGGLPPGHAVAISPEHPDVVVFASEHRLHVSRDGGRFWQALALELPSITRVRLT
jgi:hypothetical protein